MVAHAILVSAIFFGLDWTWGLTIVESRERGRKNEVIVNTFIPYANVKH